jgi:hypothetical protein
MYPALDIKDVTRYPNKFPLKHVKNLLRFNGDPSCVIPLILSLVRYASTFEGGHKDLLVRAFLCSLEWKQRAWRPFGESIPMLIGMEATSMD